jgi:deazaflavin-dependent oxidoreductase (nitroreductase family)
MKDMSDFMQQTITEFRGNHGKVGGYFAGAPLLLLHTVGAKTGAERVTPMMYLKDGDRYLVFATKGGADTNPGWYHNLIAHPDVTIEVGDDTIEVRATALEGAERDEKYALQATAYPSFAEYEIKTTRRIPVIALTPTAG